MTYIDAGTPPSALAASPHGRAPLPRYVEVETSRKCNRTCGWCPNGENAARQGQDLMPWSLYSGIIDELGTLDYSGWLAFHNYNEPLLNERLTQEIDYAKSAVPQSKPAIYTNGDVLRRELFERLVDSGVEYIRITRYPHRADTPPSFAAIEKWLRQAGLYDRLDWAFQPVRQGLAAVAESGASKVEIISPQILESYNNRGGSVTMLPLAAPRTAPCLMTATSATIDYHGWMKMCCCVYPDTSDHARYVIGDLNRSTFLELWNSAQMIAYRHAHAAADWSLSPACRTCTQPLPETRL
ncbi:radical SAM/SPASM domain-containing protein [Nocardia sp. NPDC004604]|uniref:radical SAM/SPASM domain-containing protein n=1 Tax=Nocardia sp. NPDC004604 TaxID=3157013 RepID=UPI0033A25750